MKKIALMLALLLLLSAAFVSCKRDNGDADNTANTEIKLEPMNFFEIDISEYVALGEYSGLDINCEDGQSRGDAVWAKVVDGSEIKKYPEHQVNYYFEQARTKYEYLARQGNDTYENILAGLGVTEEDMIAEARELTRDDLVFAAVVKAENISLSDADKNNNFDKYVEKFVDSYGYGEEYVRENMSEQIYETMLFDKMLEKLITLNNFASTEG
ncbi:MAG: hypothetical protein J6A83_04595 [Clostridia bacterium]|nr:hypothetical protein [Clostridia bacterium]